MSRYLVTDATHSIRALSAGDQLDLSAHRWIRRCLSSARSRQEAHTQYVNLAKNAYLLMSEGTSTIFDWRLDGWNSETCSRSIDDRAKRPRCHDHPEP